jgi:hypothetical protein
LPESWHRQITIRKWSYPNINYGEAVGLAAQNEIDRKASPATLRSGEKSAWPVSSRVGFW